MENEKSLLINGLLFRLLEGDASDDDIAQLRAWMRDNPQAMGYYWSFMVDYAAIKKKLEMDFDVSQTEEDTELFGVHWWDGILDIQGSPEVVASGNSDTGEGRKINGHLVSVGKRPGRKELFQSIRNIAALLILAVSIILVDRYMRSTSYRPEMVATVIESTDSQWGDVSLDIQNGKLLRAGTYYLKDGFSEILFARGAKIVLEAPSYFNLETDNRMYLRSGKLVAYVNQEARGFTVQTPSGSVVDYGTEFGVAVDENGVMQVTVFEGRVAMQNRSSRNRFPDRKVLTAGSVGKVEANNKLTVNEKALINSNHYVRNIPVKWNNKAPTGYWHDPASWTTGNVPKKGDTVFFGSAADSRKCIIDPDSAGSGPIQAGGVFVGVDAWDVEIYMKSGDVELDALLLGHKNRSGGRWFLNGGRLRITGVQGMMVGDDALGAFFAEGGLLEVTHDVHIGAGTPTNKGTMHINGARVLIGDTLYLGSTRAQNTLGRILVYNGLLAMDNLVIYDNGHLVLGLKGFLTLEGDQTELVKKYIDENKIRMEAVIENRKPDLFYTYDKTGSLGLGSNRTVVRIQ